MLENFTQEEDIQNVERNIILIALDNLVDTCNNLLEDTQNLEKEQVELINTISNIAEKMLMEYSANIKNPKPVWSQLNP